MNLAAKLALGIAGWGACKAFVYERAVRHRPLKDRHAAVDCYVLAPVWEELAFREVLNPLIGPASSSLLFGIGHATTPLRFFDAAANGLVLSIIHAQGGLPLAILAHAAHNMSCDAVSACFGARPDSSSRRGLASEAKLHALRAAILSAVKKEAS